MNVIGLITKFVLNTVIKMRKNEFCLNFYTGVRNTNFTRLDNGLEYQEMSAGFDLNTAFGHYRSSTNAIMASLLHKPSNYQAGEATVDWYPADVDSKWGLQVFRRTTYAAPPDISVRSYSAGDWQNWIKVITSSDISYLIKGVKANNIMWLYEVDDNGPFIRLNADGKRIAFWRVSGTYE